MMAAIRFAGDLSPWVAFSIAIVAAIAVMILYGRETRSLDAPYNYVLPALRASAVVMVLLILAGPVWHQRRVVGTLGQVVFAVDVSQSMSNTDSGTFDSQPDRLSRALRLLIGDGLNAGWVEQLRSSHAVDVIAFSAGDAQMVWSSGEDEEVPNSIELTADGQRTDLSTSLATMLASLSRSTSQPASDQPRQAAIVLLSDGRDNLGPSPVDVAADLKSVGAEVHTIGMGSEDEPADAGIIKVERPESVASDGTLSGNLLLKQYGMSDQDLNVRIEMSNHVIWQKTVRGGSEGQQLVRFEIDVEPVLELMGGEVPRGVRRSTMVMDLRAVVEPAGEEASSENNTMPFRVAASMRDGRLLILDGSSRWETRYIRNLFERDPAWQVDTLLFGAGTDMPKVERGDKPGQFPDSLEAIGRYDAIVLGEVPPEQIGESDVYFLQEFVTRGGGLIVVDGRYDRVRKLAQKWLPELIPVEYLNGEPPMPVRSIRPSRMGLDHPVMNFWGDKEKLAEFWERLVPPSFALRIKAQQGAEVWADAVSSSGHESPWIVTRLYGAGRVFYLSTDQTWRWRYKVADRFHARFWNQLLTAVMQPPYAASDDYVALGTDKIEYDVGESSGIRARLQDPSGKPVGDATVDALLISDDRVVATVPLAIDDPARGTYRGQTPPLDPGAYQVRIRASGFDSSALQATTPIWVGSRDNIERRRVSLDANAMNQIARAGGGLYFHESSADAVLESIRPLSNGSVVESDILIWQSFYWFGAVILLLALEWWMRKRAGLV
ncbi:MAG: VWA domain-containing protein [Pirellulales bacterium]|nr:VWA domain-containing protein [Pirellulales bacterium]